MSHDGRGGRPASAGPLDDRDDDSLDLGQIRHYLYAPLRRPLLVVVPWVSILILSIIAFFVLPKRYKSSTLILVESEKVPDKFVQKVATDDRGARLETILPEILSRTRLERVLQETHPYPQIDSRTQAVERLQRAISVNVSGNDGFTIEFVHTDPRKAQEVTNRVATLFMEETMKSREQQVEGAVDFLTTQVADAKKEVEKKDEALRVYKQAHMGALPEQLQTNLATMQMLQQALQNVEESLIFARDKRDSLARGSGIRTPAAAPPAGAVELTELRRQLAALRGRYTDAHPDVQSLRARIARLEARLSTMPAGDGADAGDPASPVYREQLEQTNNEIKKLEAKQAELESRIGSVRNHIEETPRTEQELANLTRDYNKLNDNYTALFAKQLEARMAGQLEQRWKGDQFRMLDPANLPEKAYFPKAPLVIGMGLVLGLLVGLAAALVAEYIDSSVKDADDLHSVMTYTVLARIPHFPAVEGPPGPITGAGKDVDTSLVDEIVFSSGPAVAPTLRVPIIESLDDPRSIVGEEFRLLRVKVQTLRQQRAMGCLALVSALPGEGKSSIATGLATALARESGRKVLLMEADLRRPSISIALGVPPSPGLAEFLNGTDEQAHVRRVEPGGFFLLGAGEARLQRPEDLGSPRMESLLKAARSEFDTVIVDATPVLPVADAVMLQDLVDGFLFVVRSRWTPRAAIQDAMRRLHSDKIIGVVLNDVQEYRHSYMSYAYHGYNMRAGTGASADRSTPEA